MTASLRTLAGLLVLTGCAANPQRAEPEVSDCCAEFGIDVNPVLGPKAVNCGTINTRAETSAVRSKNRKAVACVRRAQSRDRPLVFNLGFSIFPDYYLRNVVIFGALGEKILVQIEHEHDGATWFAGPCTELKLLDEGDLEYSGCQSDEALLARMKPQN